MNTHELYRELIAEGIAPLKGLYDMQTYWNFLIGFDFPKEHSPKDRSYEVVWLPDNIVEYMLIGYIQRHYGERLGYVQNLEQCLRRIREHKK